MMGLEGDFAERPQLSRLIVIYASCLMVSKARGLTISIDFITENARTISEVRPQCGALISSTTFFV
jgi:hypothetical protein